MTDTLDAELQARAASVRCDLDAQDEKWGTRGWTRRKFLAGFGMAGVAALGSQLVTARASFADTPTDQDRTLVVVFLRGAADGLRVLQPATSDLGLDYLQSVRPQLLLGSNAIALSGTQGWALNPAMQPLHDALWSTGELAFVPAVSASGISRSHFQAQAWLEHGGSDTASTGWLDRTLATLGPGTTFRAVSEGSATPVSMLGADRTITLTSLADFTFPGWAQITGPSEQALLSLYRGVGGPLGQDVPTTMSALSTAKTIRSAAASSVTYPSGDFASSLQDLALILRAEVGLQVATVDVGGWDTHTDEVGQLDGQLSDAAAALSAFMADLGPERRSRVTVVVMTEFGRRVMMNASGGTDHGHGSVMWLLGGGLAGSNVYGSWQQLTASSLDQGDVPGLNSPFDVLGEVVSKRLNAGSLSTVFPGHTLRPLGVATTT